jgi:phage terminase small subunit
MSAVRHPGGRVSPLSLCHILYFCATWSQFAQARSQLGMQRSIEFQPRDNLTNTNPQTRTITSQLHLVVLI